MGDFHYGHSNNPPYPINPNPIPDTGGSGCGFVVWDGFDGREVELDEDALARADLRCLHHGADVARCDPRQAPRAPGSLST